jgi:hypothetical protein
LSRSRARRAVRCPSVAAEIAVAALRHRKCFGKCLDLFPVKDDGVASEFYKFHLMPIHTSYLLRTTDSGLELAGLDLKWLKDYLAANPEAIEHTTFKGQILITAATDDLQPFLLEHQDRFTVVFELSPIGI